MAKPARALQHHQDHKVQITGTPGAYTVDPSTLNVVLNDHVKFKNDCAAAVYLNFTLANGTTPTATRIGHKQSHTFKAEVVGTLSYSVTAQQSPVKKVMPGDDPYVIIVGSSDSAARS